jgi:hypothetical protein
MNVGGWILTTEPDDRGHYHLVPDNDLKPHSYNLDCPCKPIQDDEAPSLYAHNSYDGREAIEENRIRKQ